MKKHFIISLEDKKQSTGSDFYLDMMSYFRSKGFVCHNTLKYGHAGLLFYELYLLFSISARSKIVTTWPGFPRQMLVLNGITNGFRYRLVSFFARLKKWEITLFPVDLPLRQFRDRLSDGFVKRQQYLEDFYFNSVMKFLTCGSGMTNYFLVKFPDRPVFPLDLYCQKLLLPEELPAKNYRSSEVKIAVSGNLARMAGDLDRLPVLNNTRYYFTGPNGKVIEEKGRDDLIYLGVIPEGDLVRTLSDFDFGLVLYSPGEAEYFRLVIAGKLTTYILAGLPVICPAHYSSMAQLVERKKIGVVIPDLDAISGATAIDNIKHSRIRENCLELASAVTSWSIYDEALHKAGLD